MLNIRNKYLALYIPTYIWEYTYIIEKLNKISSSSYFEYLKLKRKKKKQKTHKPQHQQQIFTKYHIQVAIHTPCSTYMSEKKFVI